jgi:hypoxanthine phosphoribosyltransferase
MHTYLPDDATIEAYLRDYLYRSGLDQDTAACRERISHIVWVPLGISGVIMHKRLVSFLPERSRSCVSTPLRVDYNRHSGLAMFPDFPDISPDSPAGQKRFENREVIILDSSVHTGKSMRHACNLINGFNPRLLSTCTLFLKRGGKFIPNYFAVLIHDWDRALFWLDKMPVNRLDKDIHEKNVQLRYIESMSDLVGLDRSSILNSGGNIFTHPEEETTSPTYRYVCSQKNTIYGMVVFYLVQNENIGTVCRICGIRAVRGAKNLNVVQLLLR